MSPALAGNGLLAAIPGDNPSGQYLRYEPVYDQLKQARKIVVEEDQTFSGPDHKLVVKLATEALETQTKDLQIAVWLTDALIGVKGLAGLCEGLELIHGLLQNFWDTLYPQVVGSDASERLELLDWVGGGYAGLASSPIRSLNLLEVAQGYTWERYRGMIEGKSPAADFDTAFDATGKDFYKRAVRDAAESLDRLRELRALTDEHFGKEGPSFIKLRELLEGMKKSFDGLLGRKLEQDPDPVEAVAASAPAESAITGETAGQIPATEATVFAVLDGTASGAAPASAAEAYAQIAAAAHYLRRQNPRAPSSYLVLRGLRWGELRANGAELPLQAFAAPPAEVRTKLRRLADASHWSAVLELAEQAMATECGRAWLDLQRYAVTACENLGYEAAATAIRRELRALLADYPDLASATLPDDTGAANPATVVWLRSVAQKEE